MTGSISKPEHAGDRLEEFKELLQQVLPLWEKLIPLAKEFCADKAMTSASSPCASCPKFGECKEPCDLLNSQLPKSYGGKGHHERNINLDFDEFEGPSDGSHVAHEDEQHQMQIDHSRFKSIPIVTSLDIFEEYRQC